jgi:hypothetical protein
MLLEGNECDPQPWSSAFDIEPTSLEEGLRQIFSN